MKKILSLVVALIMVLTAVSALAVDSKTADDINNATTNATKEEAEAISLEIIDDTEESATLIQKYKEAYDAGDVMSALPDDVKTKLPEGFDKINEIVTAHFVGDTEKAEGTYEITVTFATPYEAGTEVYLVFSKLDESGFEVFKGEAQEDGSVKFTVTADQIKVFGNDPFVILAVNK